MSTSTGLSNIDVEGMTTEQSPFPSATRAGDFIFVSGQVSKDENKVLVGEGDIYAQTVQTLKNLEKVLAAYDLTLASVATTTVYINDAALAGEYNRAWVDTFAGHRPSRATIVAPLLNDKLLVEVQATAWAGK
ncbi:RidA family protein [Paeniglutamicibacter sp. R2-26]|uniref:RidA family protein n=1 Tax=Paeniglutamicibacter sp. R2-26 TaxID=3144417 RepID=UPI003EE5C713